MLIGICGKKQVGKSTAGTILALINCFKQVESSGFPHETIYNYIEKNFDDEYILSESQFNLKSFSERLKKIAGILCNNEYTQYEDVQFKNKVDPLTNISNRQVLQYIKEAMRNLFGENIWIKALFRDYFGDTINGHQYWIITDVEYKNEADYIKNKGGILIKINRNTGYNDNHISEIDLDDYDKFDYIVDNNGTINQLIDKMVDIYNNLSKK